MKRFFLILMIFSVACLAGCDREKYPEIPDDTIIVIDGNLGNGSIIIIDNPDVKIQPKNEELIPVPTEPWLSPSRKRMGVKAATDGETQLSGHEYRFKLVAEVDPLQIDEYPGFDAQATDVKITDDGFAFVSYNDRGDPHRGGVVVYRYTVSEGTLETATVDVETVTGIQMPHAEVSAIEYYNNKLYMIGASSEPKFGYNENEDGFNYAFLLVMDMNADKTFNRDATPKIVKLTSFQGTSIRVRNDRIYVTTGDGTNGTNGGLYILKSSDYSLVKFIEGKDHARSVDVDATHIYLMQAEPERVTKFNLNGENETEIYTTTNESMQKEAKSEILAWGKYLFTAENESGLRMIFKENGEVNHAIDRPGEDVEKHVTNSVCMNSDTKKDAYGNVVTTDLLLVANGEKGIYWYDVMTDANGADWIVACGERNSLLGVDGLSANFISSKGNIVFVADGLGGLKILYIGEEPKEIIDHGCPDDAIFRHETFLKENGNSKIPPPGLPLDRKVGDVFFQVEGNNLVVYLRATAPPYKINGAGVLFGTSPEDLEERAKQVTGKNLFSGGGDDYKSKNINNGTMTDMYAEYRTVLSDGIVKYVFPREILPNNGEGELLFIVYGAIGWGYGDPYGPSGTVGGSGVHNNGQIIVLNDITFCE